MPVFLLTELRDRPSRSRESALDRSETGYMSRSFDEPPTRRGAPGGTRTHTGRCLRPHSLPIGIPGLTAHEASRLTRELGRSRWLVNVRASPPELAPTQRCNGR